MDGERAVNNAVAMLTLMGVLFMVLGLIFLKPLALMFGATENILPYAMEYGRVIVIGLPFFIVSVGLNSILRADGNPQVSMTSMLAGAVFNVIFNPVLIYIAHWGVTGAAIATVGGQIITCAICVVYLRKLRTVKLDTHRMKPSLHYTLETVKLGISSFVVQISIVISMFVANNMLVKYGAASKIRLGYSFDRHAHPQKIALFKIYDSLSRIAFILTQKATAAVYRPRRWLCI